jgi:hypothetical protein
MNLEYSAYKIMMNVIPETTNLAKVVNLNGRLENEVILSNAKRIIFL